jgi:hypothetical protein
MLGAPDGLSLEQVAVMLAMQSFDNHVYHKGVWADEQDAALLVSGEEELGHLADVLLRHPKASVELHSHISPGNQPHTHRVTQLRGEAVKHELQLRGIHPAAVSTVSWGDRIALRSRWRTLDAARERGPATEPAALPGPDMHRSTTCERDMHRSTTCERLMRCAGTVFFVSVGEACFPPRPSVYDQPVATMPQALPPSLFGMDAGQFAMMALSINNAGLGLGFDGHDDDDDDDDDDEYLHELGSASDQTAEEEEEEEEEEETAEPLL